MPIPSPRKTESKSDFVSRCMGDSVMVKDFEDQSQRAAVCYSTWEKKKESAAFVISVGSEEYIAYSDESLAAEKPLNKPFRTPKGPKKFSVYVKNDKGNVVKVNFGDPDSEIKRDDPERRKNFRARHNCDNPGPKWKSRHWACKFWSNKSVTEMTKGSEGCADCAAAEQIDWDNLPTEMEIRAMYPQIEGFGAVPEENE